MICHQQGTFSLGEVFMPYHGCTKVFLNYFNKPLAQSWHTLVVDGSGVVAAPSA